ncbi:MAG TPA: hypothetical protein VGN34_00520, partial [Ktedonobacteraceae bacterium]
LFNPAQSNLAPASQLPIAHSTRFSSGASVVTHQLREIWPWVAALLLLILCAEWWLFSRPYQAQQARGSNSGRLRSPPLFAATQKRWFGRYQAAQKRLKKTTRRFRGTLTKQFARGKKRANI